MTNAAAPSDILLQLECLSFLMTRLLNNHVQSCCAYVRQYPRCVCRGGGGGGEDSISLRVGRAEEGAPGSETMIFTPSLLASFPGHSPRRVAWYSLFAHARNIPGIYGIRKNTERLPYITSVYKSCMFVSRS